MNFPTFLCAAAGGEMSEAESEAESVANSEAESEAESASESEAESAAESEAESASESEAESAVRDLHPAWRPQGRKIPDVCRHREF